MGTSVWRRWWIYPLIFLGLTATLFTVFTSSDDDVRVSRSEFIAAAEAGLVSEVEVDSSDRLFVYHLRGNDVDYEVEKADDESVQGILRAAGVPEEQILAIEISTSEAGLLRSILGIVIALLPVALVVALIAFLLTRRRKRVAKLDPVCLAPVSRKSAGGSSIFQEVTYYFCSADHKLAFDQDPVRYLLHT